MNTIWKYIQYGYLVVAVIFVIEAVINWGVDRQKSYFLIGFAIFMVILFFFKRKFRRKIEARKKQ